LGAKNTLMQWQQTTYRNQPVPPYASRRTLSVEHLFFSWHL